jgi:hypothetical protein
MIQREPPHSELSADQIAAHAWIVTGDELHPGDVLLYWGLAFRITGREGAHVSTAGWTPGFHIEAGDRWPIMPRKDLTAHDPDRSTHRPVPDEAPTGLAAPRQRRTRHRLREPQPLPVRRSAFHPHRPGSGAA